jgi:putative FmdB family regulatory protein
MVSGPKANKKLKHPTSINERKDLMPIYDYKCKTCDLRMSVIRKIDEPDRTPLCANCVKDLIRVYDTPAVSFKGTGWGKD